MNPKIIDDIAKRVAAAMPGAVTDLHQDVEKNVHVALQSVLARFNLVTREEFEVQRKVLANLRAALSELEQRVDALEAGSSDPGQASGQSSPGQG